MAYNNYESLMEENSALKKAVYTSKSLLEKNKSKLLKSLSLIPLDDLDTIK